MRAFWLIFAPAAAYQCIAIAAGVQHLLRRRRDRSTSANFRPGVSVLKPLRGLDPNTYQAFRSQACQDYANFEILFGVADENDPAVCQVHRLQREFPQAPIRLVITGPVEAANGKVGVLIRLAREARYPVLVVNDSDIQVTPSYLSAVVAPLADEGTSLVTCLYRVQAHNAAALWEALGISTDFLPSTLVAQLIGMRAFGFGSTLAFRAADLERAGGFEALANYLADDYQLARRLTATDQRALISTYVVETSLEGACWRGIWRHQLRWARTIRLSKGGGYAGLFITHTGVWMIAALAASAWRPAAVLGSLRIASALLSTGLVLRSPGAAKLCWLAPAWDLYAFANWAASYRSRRVEWRGRTLLVNPDGRIQS
ncbi:MAG: bacteriohopanetetrol glucosamine biosynthesis glycosyltransferase HpnI [Bryobacteraceae bacterium]